MLLPTICWSSAPLTSEDRVNAFIVDDSLFERTSCRKTELGSKVFDHVSMRYTKGSRLMALSWTDGNTLIPVNRTLLASSKEENILGMQKSTMAGLLPAAGASSHR